MNKHWAWVVVASLFEVMWVTGLKHAYDMLTWSMTVIAIGVSFYLMIRAGNALPVGTVYAVFVGLGTAGTVLSEALFFDEPLKPAKLVLIIVLLVGIVGLKLVTPPNRQPEAEGADSK